MLLDDIRSHLAVANEDQRKRRGAVLLREAAAEIERLLLTDDEREAIETSFDALQYAADELGLGQGDCDRLAATLRGLLERTNHPAKPDSLIDRT
jgi:hypothetical protein